MSREKVLTNKSLGILMHPSSIPGEEYVALLGKGLKSG